MPKYATKRKPEFALAVDQLKAVLVRKGLTFSEIAKSCGIPQPQLSKILNGIRKKPNEDFYRLCRYAGIDYPPVIRDPLHDPRIQAAIKRVFDGTDRSIELIARLIECADVLNDARTTEG